MAASSSLLNKHVNEAVSISASPALRLPFTAAPSSAQVAILVNQMSRQ